MKTLSTLAIALALAGCTTPPVALQNANRGMEMAGELRSDLERYELGQRAVAAKRTQRLLDELEAADHARAAPLIEHELAVVGAVRQQAALRALKEGARLRAEVDALRQQDAAEREAMWDALQQPAHPPVAELNAAAQAFSVLGTKESQAERAEQAFEFARELYSEVKKDRDAAAGAPVN